MSPVRKDFQMLDFCEQGADIFSTCGKRQYMAILTNDENHVLGIGYNGGPPGAVHCDDGGCPRLQAGSASGSSYDNCIAVHAEQNAFLHSDYNARPTKLYVNGPPCYTCAKLIVNSTVKSVFYIDDPSYKDFPRVKAFMEEHGVEAMALDWVERYVEEGAS